MISSPHITIEAMEADQEEFITRRYKKESKLYIRSMNLLLVLAIIIPLIWLAFKFLFSTKMVKDELIVNYFLGFGFLLIFFGIIAIFAYFVKLHALAQDYKHKKRVIEKVNITQKKFMKMNNSHHFYLDSPTMVSVEVSPEDYNRLQINDEINIEFAKYSKEFFGYF